MQEVNLPGYQPTTKPNFLQIQKAYRQLQMRKNHLFLRVQASYTQKRWMN